MTRPKNGPIWCNISGYTGPFFAIFTPYKRALRADDGSVASFPIYRGTLPWQPNNIAKMYQRRLPSMSWSLGVAAELTAALRLKCLRRKAAG